MSQQILLSAIDLVIATKADARDQPDDRTCLVCVLARLLRLTTTSHVCPTSAASSSSLIWCGDSIARATNQCHQLRFTRTQANHVLFLGRGVHCIPRVFNAASDPRKYSRLTMTLFDISCPVSICHCQDRIMLRARNSLNIKFATNDLAAHRISKPDTATGV